MTVGSWFCYKGEGAGRPTRVYRLAKPLAAIIDDIEREQTQKGERTFARLHKIGALASGEPRLQDAHLDHEKTLLQRQIDATDASIDKQVYELYGLTEEEIAVVEGATQLS